MAKKIPKQSTRPVVKRGSGYAKLVKAIGQVNDGMATRAALAVNQALVLRNWLIGASIVEFEQNGADRAQYGARLLPRLAKDLQAQAIKGLGAEVLRTCRLFFLSYPGISQTLSGKFELSPEHASISQTVGGKLGDGISQPVIDRITLPIRQTASDELPTPLSPEELLRFSWSQLQELIRIEDLWKRAFYEDECLRGQWSVRQLQRQIGSLLYEQTALSTNKRAVIERARKQEPPETIADMLRDPYILEFTGLSERPEYSEDELESALLDHYLAFEAEIPILAQPAQEIRPGQPSPIPAQPATELPPLEILSIPKLRCFVVIDLKRGAFKPEYASKMNFYLNVVDDQKRHPDDQPSIGLILCQDKKGLVAEYALRGMTKAIGVSEYQLTRKLPKKLKGNLPTIEEIEKELGAP